MLTWFKHYFHYRSNCHASRVEKSCLIFALINAIVVSAFLGECVYFNLWFEKVQFKFKIYKNMDSKEYLFNIIYCVVLNVSAVVCFFFAVILCYGVCKQKPSFVKVYLIFGVTAELLGLIGTCVFIIHGDHTAEQWAASAVAFIICGIYPYILVQIRRTYLGMSKEAAPNCHQNLIIQSVD